MRPNSSFRCGRLIADVMLVALAALVTACSSGDSTTGPSGPAQLPPAGALHFSTISSGVDATCGIAIGGAAYCWGSGDVGEIGDGVWDSLGGADRSAQRTRPTAVIGGHSFTSISVGWDDTCAITTDGAAYCWGADWYGSLGSGAASGVAPNVPTPSQVIGGFTFARLSTGYSQTCGLTRSSAVVCWGLIATGTPAIMPAYAGRSIQGMNVGGSSAYGPCFMETSGATYCGGLRDSLATELEFTAISVGFTHSCALTRDGRAYCWGLNDEGQLGNDTTTATCNGYACSDAPLAITGGLTFLSISVGQQHSCGVTTAHEVYCWGEGSYGQLGDGSNTTRGVAPRKVAGGLSFSAVTAGYITTCGLTTDGFAYCWGEGGFGGLGSGSTNSSRVPVPVAAP